jgi:hypothetical protein
MASAPQIDAPDGSRATSLTLSTNQRAVFLSGLAAANTIDIQVSINGGPFVSDSAMIRLDGPAFAIPNLASFPDGLDLDFGQNTILLRAIDIVGGVSPSSTAQITRVQSSTQSDAVIPTGIRVRRRRGSVTLLVSSRLPTDNPGFTDPLVFRGFNFYASTSPGGSSGRFRINASPISEVTTQEEDITEIVSSQAVFTPQGNIARTVVTLEDEFGQVLSTVSDTTVDVSGVFTDMRFNGSLSAYELEDFVGFTHVRSGTEADGIINSDQFVDVDGAEPLYYTITAIFFDRAQNLEFETPHSQEVLGSPLVIDTTIRDLPGRTQIEVVRDYVSAIQRLDQEISLIPGSTSRDVSIDPFASEVERVWFIIDFVHRSGSFLTLLQIDDANGDGVSDSVAGNSYKQALKAALGLQSDPSVQSLIDTQFDKIAGNYNKTRLPGRPAVGQVVYFSGTRPRRDVIIPSGSVVSTDADSDNGLPAVRYVVGGTFVMTADAADAFFNFDTQQYEITVDVTAEFIGTNGNRSAGQIKNLVSGVSGLQVVNREATRFGTLRESNADLATRAQLGFVGVDAGTEGGYAATAAESIGIVKSKIVKSGDPLMMRDYDELRKKHIGGKVDIWVQGLRERTVAEKFAFSFQVARDIRCEIVDLATLTFRVLDARVTVGTPVGEILDDLAEGLGVRNATTGSNFDLTGVIIIDFETFRLNASVVQPSTHINDIITADYRFRSINRFTFSLQPVRRVVSVAGQSSGPLDLDDGFNLYKTDDPLLTGESTIAKDFLVINQVGGIPTGDAIPVTAESHILIGFFEEPLRNVGINTATLKMFSQDRLVEYFGPTAAAELVRVGSVAPDYEIVAGTATTPVKIVRTNASRISSGETVLVDYQHDENFTVTYVINDLLQQLQQKVDARRHVTADVIVKQAVQNSVVVDTTVQLKQGASKDSADPAIRTNVSIELNSKLIGQGTAQSDMINAIDSTEGVDFQVLPLARMGYADGSRKLRVTLLSTNSRLSSLDIGSSVVFILSNPLNYPTTDGGGLLTEHKGVFEDDEPLTLAASLLNVGAAAGQAYIIGRDGASIAGFSDDATLIADGFTDADDIAAERLRLTANHIVVSLSGAGSPVDNPDQHRYAASYVIRGDRGPHDIVPTQVEFIDLGNFTLTIKAVEAA